MIANPGFTSSFVGPAKAVLAWRRFGPYHHARARAAAKWIPLIGLESSNLDVVNSWAEIREAQGFEKATLFADVDVEVLAHSTLRARINTVLDQIKPHAIFVHGYAGRDALLLLDWAVRNGCPAIMMSDSNAYDGPRNLVQEWAKRRILRLCSAAFAAGTDAKAYLHKLGMRAERVFVGYDVVDNDHFAQNGTALLQSIAAQYGPFFLASARFVETKNHRLLLEAYASYVKRANNAAWKLVVLGDGTLRDSLKSLAAALGLTEHVYLPGFKQYDELPAWYGAASCFVHPSATEQWGLVVNEAMAAGLPVIVSKRCGCAADLVEEGVNGFTFDPSNANELADLMHHMAHADVNRKAMGRASQEIIANWGPERFAAGLSKAMATALCAQRPKATLLHKSLLWVLTRR